MLAAAFGSAEKLPRSVEGQRDDSVLAVTYVTQWLGNRPPGMSQIDSKLIAFNHTVDVYSYAVDWPVNVNMSKRDLTRFGYKKGNCTHSTKMIGWFPDFPIV